MIVSIAKASEAAEVLGVELKTLTPDILSKAYRKKTKDCHPDHHGSKQLQMWARVSWAKECLSRWLERNPPQSEPELTAKGDCRACGGTGRVKVGYGFAAELTMWCVICEGKGSVEAKEYDGD